MEQEGTIRNSHRETTQVKRKIAPREQQEKARSLVERASQTGCVIRQHLDLERMKQPLQKGVFYVAENDGNAEPGFLVFLPNQAPIFLQMKKNAYPPCTLRMRVSPDMSQGGGSILIATFDTIQHTLRIEDVWMWKGEPVFDTDSYSHRREKLKEFVDHYWIPDARLMGGVQTTILNPKSVEEAMSKPMVGIYTIDLIPELPGRRRMWIECEKGVEAPKKMQAVKEPVQPKKPSTEFLARAQPVDKMPDIYDLYDENDMLLGRGSVQAFSLSKTLREMKDPIVHVRWNVDFNGYEILNLK